MYATQSAELGINLPCRKIAAIPGDSLHHRFLVGTYILPIDANPTPNEIHLLRFHEDMNELGTDSIFSHWTGEVMELAPHSSNKQLFFTCGSKQYSNTNVNVNVDVDDTYTDGKKKGSKCVLWKMPPPPEDDYYGDEEEDSQDGDEMGLDASLSSRNRYLDASSRTLPLEPMSHLPIKDQTLFYQSLWNATSPYEEDDSNHLMTLTNENENLIVSQWDMERSDPDEPLHRIVLPYSPSSNYRIRSCNSNPHMAKDPHNPAIIAISHGSTISLHDIRTSSSDSITMPTMKHARKFHRYSITDLDYNPNRPHIIVTGGEDGLLKFWDLRHTSSSSSSSSPSNDYHDNTPIYPSTSTSPYSNSKSYFGQHLTSQSNIPSQIQSQSRPLKLCRGGHTHHITSVKYNPFHDPLILSSGSDSMVNLWRISSISSSPMMEFSTSLDKASNGNGDDDDDDDDDDDLNILNPAFSTRQEDHDRNDRRHDNHHHDDDNDDNGTTKHDYSNANHKKSTKSNQDGPDIRVLQVEHQESVYNVAWSKCDAWVWASVGLDGSVLLNHVPSEEKYKILL